MSEYSFGSVEDREMLAEMPIEKLLDFFFLQIRNLWRVDGLYFLGIEEKFGTEAATEIDARVWQIMAQIEARSLQRMFQSGRKRRYYNNQESFAEVKLGIRPAV